MKTKLNPMHSTTNFQNIFNTFENGLKAYIKDEVKKQVELAISSSEIEEEEAAVVGSDETSLVDAMLQIRNFSDSDLKSDNQSYVPGFDGLRTLLNRVKEK